MAAQDNKAVSLRLEPQIFEGLARFSKSRRQSVNGGANFLLEEILVAKGVIKAKQKAPLAP